MIYIVRHQEGSPFTNCLSQAGIVKCYDIAKTFSKLVDLVVYTCPPSKNGRKHVRPLQTASIVCTALTRHPTSVRIVSECDLNQKFQGKTNHLFVWHHEGIKPLMDFLCPQNDFEQWDPGDYNGCLVIDHPQNNTEPPNWYFEPDYRRLFKKKFNFFKNSFYKLMCSLSF